MSVSIQTQVGHMIIVNWMLELLITSKFVFCFLLFFFKGNFSKCSVAQNNVDCIHSSLIMVAGRRWYLIQCTHAGREWSYKIV